MFNRILIPLDGSPLAERAIPDAVQFARIFGSSIMLLHVLDPTSYDENPKSIDPLRWQIRKAEADVYMKGITSRIRENLTEDLVDANDVQSGSGEEKKVRVEYSIREGKTSENIVNFAHTEAIDLLVMSTHGSGGLSRWNMSSVTQKVINLIYLPVLIVRAYNQPEAEVARPRYRRILLPIDTSRRAECALPAGIALARGDQSLGLAPEVNNLSPHPGEPAASSSQTRLILAAVIKPPEIPVPEPFPIEIGQLAEQLMVVSRLAVNNYLDEMKERVSVPCETCVLENKNVSTAIHELVKLEEDIDLVVLCAHGYTGQTTWPYGSVARNYMEHGTKPVLVIQDVPRSHFKPTAAELAAGNSGER
jgi:nucleotide-binding universal stress UspA family protein